MSGFVIEGQKGAVTRFIAVVVKSIRSDAVLKPEELPTGISDLNSSLSNVYANDLPDYSLKCQQVLFSGVLVEQLKGGYKEDILTITHLGHHPSPKR